MCEKGSELIRPNYIVHWKILLYWEENINNLVHNYAPGVCVFPARSDFTPRWVYVHVGDGDACLISLIYWALVLLECVVCCSAQHTLIFLHFGRYFPQPRC